MWNSLSNLVEKTAAKAQAVVKSVEDSVDSAMVAVDSPVLATSTTDAELQRLRKLVVELEGENRMRDAKIAALELVNQQSSDKYQNKDKIVRDSGPAEKKSSKITEEEVVNLRSTISKLRDAVAKGETEMISLKASVNTANDALKDAKIKNASILSQSKTRIEKIKELAKAKLEKMQGRLRDDRNSYEEKITALQRQLESKIGDNKANGNNMQPQIQDVQITSESNLGEDVLTSQRKDIDNLLDLIDRATVNTSSSVTQEKPEFLGDAYEQQVQKVKFQICVLQGWKSDLEVQTESMNQREKEYTLRMEQLMKQTSDLEEQKASLKMQEADFQKQKQNDILAIEMQREKLNTEKGDFEKFRRQKAEELSMQDADINSKVQSLKLLKADFQKRKASNEQSIETQMADISRAEAANAKALEDIEAKQHAIVLRERTAEEKELELAKREKHQTEIFDSRNSKSEAEYLLRTKKLKEREMQLQVLIRSTDEREAAINDLETKQNANLKQKLQDLDDERRKFEEQKGQYLRDYEAMQLKLNLQTESLQVREAALEQSKGKKLEVLTSNQGHLEANIPDQVVEQKVKVTQEDLKIPQSHNDNNDDNDDNGGGSDDESGSSVASNAGQYKCNDKQKSSNNETKVPPSETEIDALKKKVMHLHELFLLQAAHQEAQRDQAAILSFKRRQTEQQKLRDEMQQLIAENKNLQNIHAVSEAANTRDSTDEINEAQQALMKAKSEKETLQINFDELSTRMNAATSSIATLQKEKVLAVEDAENALQTLKECRVENEKLTERLHNLLQDKNTSIQSINAMKIEKQEIATDLEKCKNDYEQHMKNVAKNAAESENTINHLRRENKTLKLNITTIEHRLEKVTRQAAKSAEENAELVKQLIDLRKEKTCTISKLDTIQAELTSLRLSSEKEKDGILKKSSSTISTLQAEIDSAQQQVVFLKNQLTEERSNGSEKDKTSNNLRVELDKTIVELSDKNTYATQLCRELEECRANLKGLNHEMKVMESEKLNSDQTFAQQLQHVTSQLQESAKLCNVRGQELLASEEQIKIRTKERQDACNEVLLLEQKMAEAEEKLDSALKQHHEMSQQSQAYESSLSQLREALGLKTCDANNSTKELGDISRKFEKLQKAHIEDQSHNESLQNRLQKERQRVNDQADEMTRYRSKLASVQKSLEKEKQQNVELTKQIDSTEVLVKELGAELDDKRSKVADLNKCQAKLTNAIEKLDQQSNLREEAQKKLKSEQEKCAALETSKHNAVENAKTIERELDLLRVKSVAAEKTARENEARAVASTEQLLKRCRSAEIAAEDAKTRAANVSAPLLARIEQLQNEMDKSSEQFSLLKTEMANAVSKHEAYSTKSEIILEELKQKLSVAQSDAETASSTVAKLAETNEKAEKACSDMHAEFMKATDTAEQRAVQLEKQKSEFRSKISELEHRILDLNTALQEERHTTKELERRMSAGQQHSPLVSQQTASQEIPVKAASIDEAEERQKTEDPFLKLKLSDKILDQVGAGTFMRNKDEIDLQKNRVATLMRRIEGLVQERDVLSSQIIKLNQTCAKLSHKLQDRSSQTKQLKLLSKKQNVLLEMVGEKDELIDQLQANMMMEKKKHRIQITDLRKQLIAAGLESESASKTQHMRLNAQKTIIEYK